MRRPVDFPAWKPDQGGTAGDFLYIADNVLPTAQGYAPLPRFAALPGTALPSYPLGAISVINRDALATTFAGTATDLYSYSATGWASVGSGYNASDISPWSFQQFGQWVIASNGADAPQYYDLTSSAAFAALPGTGGTAPPRIGLTAVVRNFFVGGIIDGDAATVQWSGINNPTEWRNGVGQSDFQKFPDGGDVTAISSGEYGLVFQAESIRRMTYVGGDAIFQFDVISPNIGCIHPRAFCQVGRLTFFLSSRGFMMCDGSTVTPIGDQLVDNTFQAEVDTIYYARMSCVADPVRKVVYWSVPTAEPNVWFAYSWAVNEWTRVRQAARLLVSGRSRFISLDEDYGTPDTLWDTGLSFDDLSYGGGLPVFYLFDGSNTLGAMTGANAEATLGMGLLALAGDASKVSLRRVRLDSDVVAGVTLTVDMRQRTGDAASTTTHTGPTTSGDIVVRRRGRTVVPTFAIAAGSAWTYFNGFSAEIEKAGAR